MSPEHERRSDFLALGDSYTSGEGVDPPERWPDRLAVTLREHGLRIDELRIIATTGWTTDELGAAIDAAHPANDHALVSLSIGVNNQYRHRSLENYANEFSVLLERSITFAGGHRERVFVISIPDWGVTAFARNNARDSTAIRHEIDAFNATAKSIAETHGVAFVDITDLTRTYPDEIVEDGLHPSGAQYARWVERMLPTAERALAAAPLY